MMRRHGEGGDARELAHHVEEADVLPHLRKQLATGFQEALRPALTALRPALTALSEGSIRNPSESHRKAIRSPS